MDPSWVMPFETFWDRSFMVITWWSCGDLMVNGIIWNYTIPASGVIKHSSILSSIYFDDFPLLNLHQKKGGIFQAAFDYWRVWHMVFLRLETTSWLASWSQSLKTWGMSSDRWCPKQPEGEGPCRARFQTTLNSLWLDAISWAISPIPIGSMYGIYANIGGILMVNVTIYSIHGSYGILYDLPGWGWWVTIAVRRSLGKDVGAKRVGGAGRGAKAMTCGLRGDARKLLTTAMRDGHTG